MEIIAKKTIIRFNNQKLYVVREQQPHRIAYHVCTRGVVDGNTHARETFASLSDAKRFIKNCAQV